MSYRHPVMRTYEVEWIDKSGLLNTDRVRAHSATDAEEIIERRAEFARIEFTELDD